MRGFLFSSYLIKTYLSDRPVNTNEKMCRADADYNKTRYYHSNQFLFVIYNIDCSSNLQSHKEAIYQAGSVCHDNSTGAVFRPPNQKTE